MLEILLLILKLLCYGILFLLCLCLFILCLVLFVPIRYTSYGCKKEEKWSLFLKATYLSPLLRIKVQYPSEQTIITKICSITYKPKPKKEKLQKDKPQKKKQKTSKKKKRFSLIKDIDYYRNLWQDNKDLITDVFHTAINAVATVLPKDMHAKVIYGTGMADITGFIYAAYCALQSCLPKDIHVEPVWTEKYLEGEYKLHGKIRLFPLVVALIKIISDKNVRILYKKLRRG